MTNQGQILLHTKLHRPRLPHNLVVRTRLLEDLYQAIDHQLTLVCAPAGFGKTTLACTWLERMASDQPAAAASLPTAWLSLDEDDSELNLFLRYITAAMRTIFKETCQETLALLRARQQPPDAVLYATLSNELAELPGEAILVLDDYHTVRGTEVHNMLIELARHWPRPLHLVLISRIDPPIPLTGLRAKGMLHEIRTENLRFTPEETAAYLSQAQLALQSQKDLRLLEERFEGWPAGLHLAALSLRSASSQESVLSALSSKNQNITGYLMDEVLTHQVPAIQTFLLKTSILDRLTASLCEAVVGDTDPAWNARACLDWIERSELFITPLDEYREWYRYHHLFQELLQQRSSTEMGADQLTDLHRLASAWFEEHGLVEEALHHALAAGDLDLAARLMNIGLREVLNLEDRPTLERWLRMLPEEMIQRSPQLLMIKAWALEYAWKINLQTQVLQQVEELLESDGGASLPSNDLQILRGQIHELKAQQAYFSNQTTLAIDLCRQALALIPPSWKFARGGAMFYLGMSMQASGQALAAERLLVDDYEAYGDKEDAYVMLLLESLCFNYLNSGQLEQTRRIAQTLLHKAIRRGVVINKNWGDWFLGVVYYQRYELEAAAQHFTQIVENRYSAQVTTYRDAVAGLAFIHQIKGESSEAYQAVESISQFDLEQNGREDKRTRSLRARLQLMQGDLEGAGRWADTFTDPPPDQPMLWLEEPQVTRARLLVARGTNDDLHSAMRILDALDEIVDKTHNTRYKIEILALRALVLDAVALHGEGDTGQADAALMQALDLAHEGGFIRVFVDLGKSMQAMLQRLAQQEHSLETIQRILAKFPAEYYQPAEYSQPAEYPQPEYPQPEYPQPEYDKNLARGEILGQPLSKPSKGNLVLAERLTPREIEVLSLLQGPLSIKEIALELNISYATAKRHTINLYSKLGVNQRWNAVLMAEELNILTPH